MLEGIRLASDRLSQQYHRLDILSQNVANQHTPGYQATDTGQRQGEFATWMRRTAGPVSTTGRDLDVAMPEGVFLAVQTPIGTRYTRRGDLRVDGQQQLVTGAGNPVLDEGGKPIKVDGPVRVAENGDVEVRGTKVATLGRYRLQGISEDGGSLFSPARGTAATPDKSTLHTAQLEGANVSEAQEQTTLVELLRRAEALSQAMQVQDQTLGQAFKDLGHR